MALVRVVLLVVVALLFVTTVAMVVNGDTGFFEKLVLIGIAVLLMLAVPRIQRLGRSVPR